ncbi:unnamed protein product [Prunus armeniaca]
MPEIYDGLPKTRARSSSSSFPPPHISGEGVDKHAIEIRSKLHPYSKKNLDANILHLLGNALVLGPVWFRKVLEDMAKLFKEDVEVPLCHCNHSLTFHSWVIKNMSKSYPSSEGMNSCVKWSDWIDRLSLQGMNAIGRKMVFMML